MLHGPRSSSSIDLVVNSGSESQWCRVSGAAEPTARSASAAIAGLDGGGVRRRGMFEGESKINTRATEGSRSFKVISVEVS